MEGALRSFCLHKHAWKLIDSIDGAKSSAIVYSITETAKANNLNPFRYLEYVLTVMKNHQKDTDYRFMEDLLPWSGQLPEICRSKTKTTNAKPPPGTAVKNTLVLPAQEYSPGSPRFLHKKKHPNTGCSSLIKII